MLTTNLSKKKQKPIFPFSIKKALVALEFGETDHSILDYLQFFTSKISTRVMSFVHMFPDAAGFTGVPQKYPMTPVQKELFLGGLRDIFEDMVIRKFPRKRSFEIDILEGNPLEVLLEKAKTINPDLIIIGQKNGQRLHGILAKNLARQLENNALIIPEKATHRLKNILVPIDFSKPSAMALRQAVSINKSLNTPAKIHVLYVATILNEDPLQIDQTEEVRRTILKNNIKIAFLVFLKKYIQNDDDNIHLNIEFQSTPQTSKMIQRYAQENNIDLIAIGSKGITNSKYTSLGSVTERVLDFNLPIPTFILK